MSLFQIESGNIFRGGVGALLLLASSCLHSPREPYVDTIAALGETERAVLEKSFPKAKTIEPVYRLHFDSRSGYQVSSHLFLFTDAGGRTQRGEIDDSSRLSACSIEFIDKLPMHLDAEFFGVGSTMAPGGRLNGRAWVFKTPDPVYEFRYFLKGIDGFGRIQEVPRSVSAIPIR